MEFLVDYRLEDYILSTRWEDLPPQVQQRAVVCGIDLTMALLLGSYGQQYQVGITLAKENYKEGNIPLIQSKETFGLLGASVCYSHASNSFDIDDGHNMIKGHPGTSFVGGVLAAALEKKVSYKEYLTTLVICYEVAVRFGLAVQDYYKFLHSTGTYGAFSTAAGVGRLLGFDKKQLNTALSIAEFHAPLTPVMWSVEHPSMNKDGVPFGVLIGMQAALEARAGETGYGNLLETPEYRHYVDTLGKQFEIMNLYFKPYTCCRWSHQPIQACIDLAKEHGYTYDQIAHVTVHTFDSAAKLSKIVPSATDEAQYNIAWPVASALVFNDVGYLQVRDEALKNPVVLDMMKRLSFVLDPEMEAQFPAKRLAWVEVELTDGRNFKSRVYAAPGEHTDNIDLAWETEKFLRITKPVLTEEKQHKLLELLTQDLDFPVEKLIDFLNN